MAKDSFYDIPPACPITGEDLYISELTSHESGVSLRGKFKIPHTHRLDSDQQHFLEVFIRARGVISTMEKELGISYPTVRSRMDSLLSAMDLQPIRSERRDENVTTAKRKILAQLEEGAISAEEAKVKLKEYERR